MDGHDGASTFSKLSALATSLLPARTADVPLPGFAFHVGVSVLAVPPGLGRLAVPGSVHRSASNIRAKYKC